MQDRKTGMMTGAGRVAILMGVYNGAADLPEQLASFDAQTHTDWELVASDDGSSDDSARILDAFAAEQAGRGRRVTRRAGPARGFVANFLSLLADAPEGADWVALSDQDDVWLPDRLARGVAALSQLPENGPESEPALYCSRSWIVDERLQNPRLSPDFGKPPGFRNALVQNIAPGNTILLNRAAAALARAAAPAAQAVPDLPVHDWWLYQLVTGAGGRVIRDPAPTLYYRQHDSNLIGSNDGHRARLRRIAMVLDGRFGAWNTANLAALSGAGDLLTEDSRALLQGFAALRGRGLAGRLVGLGRSGLYRQTLYGQTALWVAALLGRL
jgi:glycosyltransferase involved in cell wall biosynthesis